MQVLIVDSDPLRQANITVAFMESGYQVTPTASLKVAETCIRRGTVDLLVMTERIDGKLTHSLALLAEHRNPMVSTMLLTPRTDTDVDELFLLLPSLHCMLPLDVAPRTITRLALTSMACSIKVNDPLDLQSSMRELNAPGSLVFASARPEFTRPERATLEAVG